MKSILLVEDSKTMLMYQKATIRKELDYPFFIASTYKAAEEILKKEAENILVAMVDLNLPDAPNGEAVDLVLKYDIATIVFTGSYSSEIRKKMMMKPILTYLTKDPITNFSYALKLVKNINNNVNNKVLIVDDSKTSLMLASMILEKFNFTILTAKDGIIALDIIDKNRDIKLVITDENMPNMGGLELVNKIRQKYDRNTMAVIGVSGSLDEELLIQYLKHGANDFLRRPYNEEEFINRVLINVEMIQTLESMKNASVRDFLTGLYNRRYLFDSGEKLHHIAKRKHISMSSIMIDIDHFKAVNDNYGHLVGDKVLEAVSLVLNEHFRESDIVARYGGEEFCVVALNFEREALLISLNSLLKKISSLHVETEEGNISVTISIGVTQNISVDLQSMIDLADTQLYIAKESGRNQVQIEKEEEE